MLFSKSPQIVLYLKSTFLEFYTLNNLQARFRLDFPVTVVKDQEIFDSKALDKLIYDFLNNFRLGKHSAVMLLSEEIIFQKVIPLTDFADEQHECDKFLSEIPFEPLQLAVKTLKDDADFILYATNKHFFYPIVHILEKYGWRVQSVAPLTAFGSFGKEVSIQIEDVKMILNKIVLLRQVNFLISNTPQTGIPIVADRTGAGKKENSKVLITLIILVIIVLIIGFFVIGRSYIFNKSDAGKTINPLTPVTSVLTPSPENSATESGEKVSSPSAQGIQPLTIEKARVKVLNGSGVAGQAGAVRDRLLKLGFISVEVGNAETENTAETIIYYNDHFPIPLLDLVTEDMKKYFTNVTSKRESLTDSDISIITGK